MMSPNELHEIRVAVHQEMADLDAMWAAAGTYTHLCEAPSGLTFLAHQPCCRVLKHREP